MAIGQTAVCNVCNTSPAAIALHTHDEQHSARHTACVRCATDLAKKLAEDLKKCDLTQHHCYSCPDLLKNAKCPVPGCDTYIDSVYFDNYSLKEKVFLQPSTQEKEMLKSIAKGFDYALNLATCHLMKIDGNIPLKTKFQTALETCSDVVIKISTQLLTETNPSEAENKKRLKDLAQMQAGVAAYYLKQITDFEAHIETCPSLKVFKTKAEDCHLNHNHSTEIQHQQH